MFAILPLEEAGSEIKLVGDYAGQRTHSRRMQGRAQGAAQYAILCPVASAQSSVRFGNKQNANRHVPLLTFGYFARSLIQLGK